jgi:hypothetical protein
MQNAHMHMPNVAMPMEGIADWDMRLAKREMFTASCCALKNVVMLVHAL